MPQFGATFYPGGMDDYYMPEVVAPAPQRCVHGGFIPHVSVGGLLLASTNLDLTG